MTVSDYDRDSSQLGDFDFGELGEPLPAVLMPGRERRRRFRLPRVLALLAPRGTVRREALQGAAVGVATLAALTVVGKIAARLIYDGLIR